MNTRVTPSETDHSCELNCRFVASMLRQIRFGCGGGIWRTYSPFHCSRKRLPQRRHNTIDSVLFIQVDLPPTTAPEQCAGPPSPLCACSRSTPTEAAGGHWVPCWAVTYRSGLWSLPLKARRRLCAHIGIRGSDHRPCREPAGSSRTWMGSVVSIKAGEKNIL